MSVAAPTAIQYLPEELLTGDRDGRYELIDGQLKEKPSMGAEANLITLELLIRLGNHVRPDYLGLVFGSECGYQIFPHEPRRVRYPDGSFVRRGRLPGNRPPRGHMKIAPDLAIEVVSPNDLAEDLDARIDDFLRAGVPLIWVVYPLTRRVQVYRQDGSGARLGADRELTGEDIMPGFACPIRDLFAVIEGDESAEGPPPPEPSE